MPFALVAAYSYLLGSTPFGYLLVRTFYGRDIRTSGSGNIGATNVSRTSPVLGALTLLLDAMKGVTAVAMTRILFPSNDTLFGVAALSAVAGHVFSVWLRFKGGKGVATAFGAFAVITPKTILLVFAIFVGVAAAGRYVSLASIVAVALFPLLAWMDSPYMGSPPMLAFMSATSLLIMARHHANIRRIMSQTEPQISFSRRRG